MTNPPVMSCSSHATHWGFFSTVFSPLPAPIPAPRRGNGRWPWPGGLKSQLLLLWAVSRCQGWKVCLETSKCLPHPYLTDGDTKAQGGIGSGPRSLRSPKTCSHCL